MLSGVEQFNLIQRQFEIEDSKTVGIDRDMFKKQTDHLLEEESFDGHEVDLLSPTDREAIHNAVQSGDVEA